MLGRVICMVLGVGAGIGELVMLVLVGVVCGAVPAVRVGHVVGGSGGWRLIGCDLAEEVERVVPNVQGRRWSWRWRNWGDRGAGGVHRG